MKSETGRKQNASRSDEDTSAPSNDFIERLADLEHQQWCHWTKYFLSNYASLMDRQRWRTQMRTDYEDLCEDEKESDRKWARIVLKVFKERMTELEDVYDTGIEKRWERLRKECTLSTETSEVKRG